MDVSRETPDITTKPKLYDLSNILASRTQRRRLPGREREEGRGRGLLTLRVTGSCSITYQYVGLDVLMSKTPASEIGACNREVCLLELECVCTLANM